MRSRKPDHKVLDLIVNRWSPRAFSGEKISQEELLQLFEAARWAPSSYNNQPWRFIYAHRQTPAWDTFFALLVPFNQSWAKDAAVLVLIVSSNLFEFNKKPSRTHSFDTGAAWENLALQAHAMGLITHAMEGFDYDRAKKELHVPDNYTVEAMVAIGRQGKKENLPVDLQEREVLSDRKPVESFIFEGSMKS
jgi:nitroreductase